MGKEGRRDLSSFSRYKVTRNSGALFTAWIIDERRVKYERRRAVINANAELVVRALLIERTASDANPRVLFCPHEARTNGHDIDDTARYVTYVTYSSANGILFRVISRKRFEAPRRRSRPFFSLFVVIFGRRFASMCARVGFRRIVNTIGVLILSL